MFRSCGACQFSMSLKLQVAETAENGRGVHGETASRFCAAHTFPPLQRMQGWAVPQKVGEPDRWELTRISGGGLPVSEGWQLAELIVLNGIVPGSEKTFRGVRHL